MNTSSISRTLRRVLLALWSRFSTVVAIALIVSALLVGVWIGGRSAAPPPDATHAQERTESHEHETAAPRMYTCSMHPSVRLPDPDAKCPICFMDLIPVEQDNGGPEAMRRLTMTESAMKLAQVETTPVARFFPVAEVRLYGKLSYDRTRLARIAAYAPGRLDRLYVDFPGMTVRAGDHLAELYSPELLAAFEELRQARRAADGTSTTSDLIRRSSRDTLAAARDKLRLLGVSAEQIERAERGEMDGDTLTIHAPIGGVVTDLNAAQGDYVRTGDPIATVADLSRLWLNLHAYESQLPLLRWGQQVEFTVEARPGERFRGRISFIEPLVNDRTRSATVRVTVDNSDRRLKPGMFATAVARSSLSASGVVPTDEFNDAFVCPMHPDVVADEPDACTICGMDLVSAEEFGVAGDPSQAHPPLVIPRTAAMVTGARAVVYVKLPDTDRPVFELRTVTLGPRAGAFVTVIDGLEEGEVVVTRGAFRIDSAMQLAGKHSMMRPEGGPPTTGHQHARASEPRGAGPEHADGPDPHLHLTPEARFTKELTPVYDAYLDAQEALARDTLDGFLQHARRLTRAVDNVSSATLTGEALNAWRSAARNLRLRDEPDHIDDARIAFHAMSNALIALERRFGHAGDHALRLANCPMAFDDAGADWLQRGDVIDNPYFGALMRRCGTVEETFPPRLDPLAAPSEHDHD